MRWVGALLVCVLSGVVTALAFPPYDIAWLIWFLIAPALAVTASASPATAFGGGLLFGLAQGLMLLRWFFGIFGPFGLALLLIFAFFFGLIFRILQGLSERLGPSALPLAAAPVWVGIEFFRSECWRLRFSWFGLGYSQHDNLALLQLCSLGGVYLLSLLIAGSNGILAWAALRPSRRRGALCLCFAAVLVSLHLGGQHLMSVAPADLAVIGVEGEMEPIAHYLERTTAALRAHPGTRLVIWPEYAMDYRLQEGHPYLGLVETMARKQGVHVLFGATRSAPGERPNNFENTLFLVGPEGRLVGSQVKSMPIPFFIDGRPALARAPLALGAGLIGAAICYDMDFPYITRELVRQGAQALVYPTMDAKHWGPIQHLQHAAMAPFRAVEHHRWLVRVASSGISLVVDPYGRVVKKTGIAAGSVLDGEVALRQDQTLYTRYGYHLPHVCLLVTLGLVLLGLRRRAPL